MARKVKVDMTGVEAFVRAEEGQHVARIKSIEETASKSSGEDMLVVKYEITKGESAGAVVRDNLSLTSTALWKLKTLLDVIGMKSEGKIVLDLDKMVGKQLIVEVVHEEYNGSMQAKAAGIKKLTASAAVEDDDDFDEDEDEEPAPKKPSKKDKKKPEPEPDDEDDEDEDDEDEEEEETPAQKKKRLAKEKAEKEKKAKEKAAKDAKAKAKKKPEPEDDDDDEDDDWDEEDD